MTTELGQWFREEVEALDRGLVALHAAQAAVAWREGGWTRKQVLGHMVDSAANNRQRLVRAATEGSYTGPKYAQEAWVAAHGYAEQAWETLLRWWRVEHEILMAVVERIPEERLEASCVVGEDAAVTLRFLVEDYVRHQRHHLAQLETETKAI